MNTARVARLLALAALPWTWFLVGGALGVVTDVLTIVLPLLLGAVVVVAGILAFRRWAGRAAASVLAVSTLLMGAVAVVGPWLPADTGAVSPDGAVVVAGANVDAQGAPLDALRTIDADLWVVPELSPEVRSEFTAGYPHSLVSVTRPPIIGVFSRYPVRVLEPAGPDLPGERVLVEGPAGPFVLYALHIPRPWIFGDADSSYQASVAEHQRLADAVAARVAGETLPVVVVGDLNSTDRGRDYRALVPGAGLVDAMRAELAGPTSVGKWRFLLARIDHVLVSRGWCGDDPRRVEMVGSSHRAITVTVGPCARP